MWVFCEWDNKIMARKFVPQHLAPRVTCEQFLLGHTCEFEILWQLWIVGFYNFPTSSTLPRSVLGGSSVTSQVYGIKCWSFLHVLSSVHFTFTSKRLALAISSFIFCLDRNTERASFLLPFSIFGQVWESNTSFNQGREKVSEILGKTERNRAFSFHFSSLQPKVRETESFGHG